MKGHSLLIVKKWLQGVIEVLVFFPVFLIIGINFMPISYFGVWIGSVLLSYLFGILVRITLGDRKYITYFSIGVPMVLLMNWVVIGWGLFFVIGSILSIFLLFRGIQFIEYQWETLFPGLLYLISMFLHLIMFFVFRRAIVLKPFLPWIVYSGFAMLLISFFRMNRIELKSAVTSENNQFHISTTLNHHNKLFTIMMMGIVFLLASIRQITDGILWVVGKLLYIIGMILNYLMSLISNDSKGEMPQEQGPMSFLPGEEAKDPSIFDKIIEIIGWIILGALIIAFIILVFSLLYKGIKKLYGLIRKLLDQHKGLEETYDAYEDEKETLMNWKEIGRQYLNQIKSWVDELLEREPKWSDLKDNRERIRYIYRHFVLRMIGEGYHYKVHLTPLETLKDLQHWNEEKAQNGEELEQLYEEARYGDCEPSGDSIEKLKKDFL